MRLRATQIEDRGLVILAGEERNIVAGKARRLSHSGFRAFVTRTVINARRAGGSPDNYIHWAPLTLDTQEIALSKPFIQPDNPHIDPPERGRHGLPDVLWGITYIGKGVLGAADLLSQRPEGDRMIILMTDGESSDILPPRDTEIIGRLREANTLFSIILTDEELQPQLVRISRATGGDAFNAASPDALAAIFKHVDEMKKVVVLEKQPHVIDFYDPFFIPGLCALGLGVFVLYGLRFTPW